MKNFRIQNHFNLFSIFTNSTYITLTNFDYILGIILFIIMNKSERIFVISQGEPSAIDHISKILFFFKKLISNFVRYNIFTK